jgi:hypothetical protein
MLQGGRFRMRLEVLTGVPRVLPGNNETVYDHPEATATFSAAQESFGVNEVVAQGQNHSTRAMRIRIRGRGLPITTNDYLRDKATGVEYRITGGPVQSDEGLETIIDLAMVVPTETSR